jgi:hypothetical protein
VKTKLYFIGVLITGMLGGYVVGSTVAVPALAQTRAPNQCSVPKSYGSAKLVAGNIVGFEDASGTLRWVQIYQGCTVSIVVVRQ